MLHTLLCHFLQNVEKSKWVLVPNYIQALFNLLEVHRACAVMVDLSRLVLQTKFEDSHPKRVYTALWVRKCSLSCG